MILFFLIPLLAVPVLSSTEKLSCYSGYFGVNLSDGRRAHINGAEVNAFFRRDHVRVYAYPYSNAANLRIDETIIFFKGNTSIGGLYTPAEILNAVIHFQTKGIGKLKKRHHKTKLTKCQISFVNNEYKSLDVPREVQKEFERIVHYCVGYQICEKIGTIQPEDYAIPPNPYNFDSFSIFHEVRRKKRFRRSVPSPQLMGNGPTDNSIRTTVINAVLDVMLASMIKTLKEKHEEAVKVDDINDDFSVLAIKGHFNAKDGHFSDLTTLKRTSNLVIDRQGMKLTVSCGLGLSTAKIEFNHYELKYGAIKVDGKFSADINGIAMDAKISVDSSQQPCKAELLYSKISQFGKVNINFTGLGKLSKLSSNLVTLISKAYRDRMSKAIESKVTSMLQNKLKAFECNELGHKV